MTPRGEVRFERIPTPEVPWADLDRREDRTAYQTLPWLDVLAATQGAEPLVARVHHGGEPAGWFTGAVGRTRGLRVLGAPLRGWTTGAMGFNLDRPVPPAALMTELRRYAFGSLRCHHLEVMSRRGLTEDAPRFHADQLPGFGIDLQRPEDELFAAMSTMARRNVRRASRDGVTVEEIGPEHTASVAAELHHHLRLTFALHGSQVRFGFERIDTVLRLTHRPGTLLVLRAVAPDGRTAASGLFPGVPGGVAGMWMAAGDPELRNLRPNEALMWAAITGWRRRGARWFELGGGGDYKAKFGGHPDPVPWPRTSRWPGTEVARRLVLRHARR